jgi:omega-6 fatty acid desaturase (delta-12 desaturase)
MSTFTDIKNKSLASWREIVARYQTPSTWRSIVQLCTTLGPLVLAFVAMYFLARINYWLTVPVAIVAAGFLIRTFIIMHDCGHGSFFRSRRANDIVGFITGVLTLTPYVQWRRDHAIHHATSGHLDERGFGDISTLTVREYLNLTRWRRFCYRVYRNPLILLGVGPIALIVRHRVHNPKSAGRKEIVNVHATNLAILVVFTLASLVVGPWKVLSLYGPAMFLAAAAGIWLFYVQHQFEDTYWAEAGEWDYTVAAVEGSSFYRLPRVLDWITGSIGFHHVHHLSPRIPNYNLRRCHDENPLFQQARVLTMWESAKTFSLKVFDEERKRLIGWRELRRIRTSSGNPVLDGH